MTNKSKNQNKGFYTGGVVKIFDDLVLEFSGSMLDEIIAKHNDGMSFEKIAEIVNRNPDEVFLAVFHLARQDHEIRPVGKRLK